MIVDGEPRYVTQVPTLASLLDVSKTMIAAAGVDVEKYESSLRSPRMRQMTKDRMAETGRIQQGIVWALPLRGGTYIIECISDHSCAMLWIGDVVVM